MRQNLIKTLVIRHIIKHLKKIEFNKKKYTIFKRE